MEGLMRLGVFGGTFDPPHIGHLILADEARHQLNLSKVLWVLTPDPPHKEDARITPWQVRLKLLQAAIVNNVSFVTSEVDIDRPPPHYAYDTVRILKEQHPNAEIVYLMGGDSLHDLPTWKNPKNFLEECDQVGVMRRPADGVDLSILENYLPGVTEKVRFVDAPLLEISGSEIRHRMPLHEPIRYYLPEAVYQLILENGLYGKEW
jgi:nicotinate-nucleotide adenylyltransferase